MTIVVVVGEACNQEVSKRRFSSSDVIFELLMTYSMLTVSHTYNYAHEQS